MNPQFLGRSVCREQPTSPVRGLNYVIKALLAMPGQNRGCYAVNGIAQDHYSGSKLGTKQAYAKGGWYFNNVSGSDFNVGYLLLPNGTPTGAIGTRSAHAITLVSRFTIFNLTPPAYCPVLCLNTQNSLFTIGLDSTRQIFFAGAILSSTISTGVIVGLGTHCIALKIGGYVNSTNYTFELWLDGSKVFTYSVSGYGGLNSSQNVGPTTFGYTSIQTTTNYVVHMVALCDETAPCAQLSKNPYGMFYPIKADPVYMLIAQQYLSPNADDANSGWSELSGPSLNAAINESYPSDTDYIFTNSVGSTCTVQLSSGSIPAMPTSGSSGVTLKYRLLPGNGRVTVSLMQGSTVIATFTTILTAHAQVMYQNISAAQVSAITDFTNLSLTIVTS